MGQLLLKKDWPMPIAHMLKNKINNSSHLLLLIKFSCQLAFSNSYNNFGFAPYSLRYNYI